MPRITIPAAGLGKLAASIVGGQSAYDEGMEQGATAQSKIAQALASIRANNAAADLNSTKADAEREALARQAPGAIRENAMTRFGVPLDERGSVESFLNSGNLGGKYTPVPDDLGGGPVAPEPSWAKDLGGVAQAIAGMQEALTLGDKSVKNVAEAEGLRRNSRLSDAIIAGTADRNTVGGAQAAVDGKPLFDSNEYGSMDNFTGKVDDSGGAAQRFGQYRGAQTGKEKELAGAAKANAAQSYASADSSRATAAKTRQEMEFLKEDAITGAGGPSQVGLTKRFGKAEPGYRWKPDGTQEAIPGGSKDLKAGEAAQKSQGRKDAAALAANNVLSAVSDAKKLVGLNTTGPGSVLSKIPGTDARDLQAKLDTIKANLGFDRLQQMREMSPTGGALGAVAVQELIALQSTVASLDQAQSAKELEKSLAKIEGHYNKWLQTVNGDAPAGGSEPARVSNDAEYNALPSGAVFIDPDGKQRRKP